MSNCVEHLQLMYGLWTTGRVVVPINHKLHPREAAWMIDNCAARIVFSDPKVVPDLRAEIEPAQTTVIDVGGPECAAFWDACPLPTPLKRTARSGAALLHLWHHRAAQGLMLSNANLMAMTQSYFVDVDAVTAEDTALYAALMSHGVGLFNFVFVLRATPHVIPLSDGFDAQEVHPCGCAAAEFLC